MFLVAKSFISSAFSSISFTVASYRFIGIFRSKQEIKSDTLIMGIPVWTVFVGLGAYVVWNNYMHAKNRAELELVKQDRAEFERKLSEQGQIYMRQIQELTRLLEIKRQDIGT
jgi:hypothetical protein